MKKGIFGFTIILLFAGIYSCENCNKIDCTPCKPYSYKYNIIYYYDSNVIHRSDAKKLFLYEIDSTGKTLHLDSMNNPDFDWHPTNFWNQIYLEIFYKLTPDNISNKIFVATLKDSTFPVRIENIKIKFKDGGKGCCSCDDYLLESLKLNGKEYKPEDLSVKIN